MNEETDFLSAVVNDVIDFPDDAKRREVDKLTREVFMGRVNASENELSATMRFYYEFRDLDPSGRIVEFAKTALKCFPGIFEVRLLLSCHYFDSSHFECAAESLRELDETRTSSLWRAKILELKTVCAIKLDLEQNDLQQFWEYYSSLSYDERALPLEIYDALKHMPNRSVFEEMVFNELEEEMGAV